MFLKFSGVILSLPPPLITDKDYTMATAVEVGGFRLSATDKRLFRSSLLKDIGSPNTTIDCDGGGFS